VVKFVDHSDSASLEKLKNEAEVRVLLRNQCDKFIKCFGTSSSNEPLVLSDESGEQF